ncbi:MAG: nucleotidyltransferase family protein, partial [Methanobacteriota archaeon]
MLIWLIGLISDIPSRPPEDGEEWDVILQIFKKQDFTGYIYYLSHKVPLEMRPPDRIWKELIRSSHQHCVDHLYYEKQLATIEQKFRQAGIRYLLMKGPALGYQVYIRPTLRPFR